MRVGRLTSQPNVLFTEESFENLNKLIRRSVRTGKAGAVDVCQCPGVVNVRRASGAMYLLLCT